MRLPNACALSAALLLGCVDSAGLGSAETLDGGMDTESAAIDSSIDGELVIDSGEPIDSTVPDAGTSADTADTMPPSETCSGTTCSGACVDTNSDRNNCGGCNKVCATLVDFSVACTAGACTCSSGELICGGKCTVTREDAQKCSSTSCGSACGKDEWCTAGACECRPGLNKCGTSCVDLRGDLFNCGTCGNECGNNLRCVAGNCEDNVTACVMGRTACGADKGRSSCFNLQTDPTHCGACGTACAVDQLCIAGTCRKYAPAAGCTTCGGCTTCTTLYGGTGRCCTLTGHTLPACVDGPACP